ncbi:MAG: ribbon-helix-helix protein, CopG family [bacterium]|nr:ribbon-helix-helix protein, CopG family [bacterium]
MKISISLSSEDLAFLDSYARVHQASRSAAVRRAVGLLRVSELSSDYAAAFDEWADHGHGEEWDATVADGV